jgi:hypothetical protein
MLLTKPTTSDTTIMANQNWYEQGSTRPVPLGEPIQDNLFRDNTCPSKHMRNQKPRQQTAWQQPSVQQSHKPSRQCPVGIAWEPPMPPPPIPPACCTMIASKRSPDLTPPSGWWIEEENRKRKKRDSEEKSVCEVLLASFCCAGVDDPFFFFNRVKRVSFRSVGKVEARSIEAGQQKSHHWGT